MIRLIPPKTKTSTTLIGTFTFKDLIITVVYLALVLIFYFSGIPIVIKYLLIGITIALMVTSLLKVEHDKKAYSYYYAMVNYFLRKKRVAETDFKSASGTTITSEGIVSGSEGLLKVKAVEIKGIDFGILEEQTQDRIINNISLAFKICKFGSIFKIEKPIDFSRYIKKNNDKRTYWENEINSADDSAKKERYAKRIEVLNNIDLTLSHLHDDEAIRAEAFYFMIYDYNEDTLSTTCKQIKSILTEEGIEAEVVDEKELKVFFSEFYNTSLDEDNNFLLPEIKEKWNKLIISDEEYSIASITSLPAICSNAWLWELFAIPGTKVRFHFSLTTNKNKIYNAINKSIIELQTQMSEKNLTESRRMDIGKDIEALQLLLQQLKMDNEQLHTVSYLIMYPTYMHKKVDEVIKNNNIYVNHLYYHQLNAYMAMQPYKIPDTNFENKIAINLQSSTLAASFPFVSHLFMDPEGDYLGDSRYPVFFDVFDSWKKYHASRSNANLVILGKSGGGKSFYTKKLLLQQACNGTKIFVLDPENEYQILADNLGGNWVDMGGISDGRINPFHIFPSGEDKNEEDNTEATGELKSQRQFLQEFFTVVIPDLDKEVRPFLNQAIQRVYLKKGISDDTNFQTLPSEAYPTFDDLYQVASDWFNEPQNFDFDKPFLRKLLNALEDFKEGGLYSNLWNGPTTMRLENEFTVLNFQSLFASNNTIVANGQMLLAMRFLMQEVIKNKANNEAKGLKNNIQIIVDEAHQFINPDFPVALTFMSQMTKRIRKYGGGMVVATQNIKDFIGQNENTKAKASAVLNGCQYTAIFGLLPDDVNSIIDLYSSSGGLTQAEIDSLTAAKQGEVLVIVDNKTRITAHIELYMNEKQFLEK